MKVATTLSSSRGRGSALILSLVFIAMFSALAAAMVTMSRANVQIAENHRKGSITRACAESGLDIIRYWMSKVEFSGTTAPEQRFSLLTTTLQNALFAAGATNIAPTCTSTTITIPYVAINSHLNQSFSAVLTKIDNDTIRIDVTGCYRSLTRTIRSAFVFATRANTVFDFGIATKGPLLLSGNIDMEGANIAIESNAYIETDALLALQIIGNSSISGNVKITNRLANVYLQGGQASIGGVTGGAAIRPPYTEFGYAPTEFPEMVPSQFSQYVTSTLDPNTDTNSSVVLENIRIPAGMNPTFNGGVTLRGVVYVEQPNVVTFNGSSNICGIIVGNGSPTDNSGTNKIIFSGSLDSQPVSKLPEEPQFAEIRNDVGIFVMAPGFATTFSGPFTTVSGAIASNGITFGGGASGTINGSLLNYSPNPMSCSGNNNLLFNRSGLARVPAGFVPLTVMRYNPASYSEVGVVL